MPDHDTPHDAASHQAVINARRVAMHSLENYRVVDEKHYWLIGATVVGLVISNVALWIYVLQLPQ